MFPILVAVGPIKVYTLAVIGLLAFFVGLFVVWKRGKELHFEEKNLFDTVFIVLLWMFIGARIGYCLIHVSDFGANLGYWINFFGKPGWYYPVGMVAGVIAVSQQAKRQKWEMFQLLDLYVTGIALSQAIISLGMWLSGAGYGIPTTSVVGMHFTGVYDRRYPIQLWEVAGFTALFVYLWWVESVYRTFGWYRRHRSQAATGFLSGMYLIWWGVITAVAVLFRSPELVFRHIRFDVIVPAVFGFTGGWLLLFYRAGVTWKDIGGGFLDYFGLKKKSKRDKQSEIMTELLR